MAGWAQALVGSLLAVSTASVVTAWNHLPDATATTYIANPPAAAAPGAVVTYTPSPRSETTLDDSGDGETADESATVGPTVSKSVLATARRNARARSAQRAQTAQSLNARQSIGGAPPIPAIPVPAPLPTLDPLPTPVPTPLPTQSTPSPAPSTACGSGSVTVANYNIKAGRLLRGQALPQIATQMATWSADVIILQEVDRNRATSGKVDQAAFLAKQLGYEHTFGANVNHGGTAAYGTAILSRYPIVDAENTHLPNLPGREQRGLLRATVDVNGTPLSFYSTHLQNKPQNESLRAKQASTIVSLLAGDSNPKVVGGDFNSAPSAPAMNVMRTATSDTWTAVGSGNGWTWPSHRPRGRIDFMMYAGLTPVSASVKPLKLSDHMPIVATYSYPSAC